MHIPGPVQALLISRKFWLSVIAAATALVLYVQGQIPAEQLATLITALAAVVIGGIAIEDAGEKSAGGR